MTKLKAKEPTHMRMVRTTKDSGSTTNNTATELKAGPMAQDTKANTSKARKKVTVV